MKNSVVVKDTQWTVVVKEVNKLKQQGWKEVGEIQMVQNSEPGVANEKVQGSLAFAQAMELNMN